jgi:hypothetical protein
MTTPPPYVIPYLVSPLLIPYVRPCSRKSFGHSVNRVDRLATRDDACNQGRVVGCSTAIRAARSPTHSFLFAARFAPAGDFTRTIANGSEPFGILGRITTGEEHVARASHIKMLRISVQTEKSSKSAMPASTVSKTASCAGPRQVQIPSFAFSYIAGVG